MAACQRSFLTGKLINFCCLVISYRCRKCANRLLNIITWNQKLPSRSGNSKCNLAKRAWVAYWPCSERGAIHWLWSLYQRRVLVAVEWCLLQRIRPILSVRLNGVHVYEDLPRDWYTRFELVLGFAYSHLRAERHTAYRNTGPEIVLHHIPHWIINIFYANVTP